DRAGGGDVDEDQHAVAVDGLRLLDGPGAGGFARRRAGRLLLGGGDAVAGAVAGIRVADRRGRIVHRHLTLVVHRVRVGCGGGVVAPVAGAGRGGRPCGLDGQIDAGGAAGGGDRGGCLGILFGALAGADGAGQLVI